MEPRARTAGLGLLLAAIGVGAALATKATEGTPAPIRWRYGQDRMSGDAFHYADGRLCLVLNRNDIGEEPSQDAFTGTWTPTGNGRRWRLSRHRRDIGIPEVLPGEEYPTAPWSNLTAPEWAVLTASDRNAYRLAEASPRLVDYVGSTWVADRWPVSVDPCAAR